MRQERPVHSISTTSHHKINEKRNPNMGGKERPKVARVGRHFKRVPLSKGGFCKDRELTLFWLVNLSSNVTVCRSESEPKIGIRNKSHCFWPPEGSLSSSLRKQRFSRVQLRRIEKRSNDDTSQSTASEQNRSTLLLSNEYISTSHPECLPHHNTLRFITIFFLHHSNLR